MIGVNEVGSTKEIEQAILSLFRALKKETKQRLEDGRKEPNHLDLMSDLTNFMSEHGISEATGSTEQERFHKKWDGIISSGMTTDLNWLNPMAHKMLP